jgi:hypothetical protein
MGPAQIHLREVGLDFRIDPDSPLESVRVQVPGNRRLRIEWFDTYDSTSSFTASACFHER